MRAGNGQRDSAHDQHRTDDGRFASTVTGLNVDVNFPGFYPKCVSLEGIGTTRHAMPSTTRSRFATSRIFIKRLFLPSCATEKPRDPFASVQLCNREQQLAGQTIVGDESFYPIEQAHRGSICLQPR